MGYLALPSYCTALTGRGFLWLQTVKGGISETRIEKRIVITGDTDIDHDQVGMWWGLVDTAALALEKQNRGAQYMEVCGGGGLGGWLLVG